MTDDDMKELVNCINKLISEVKHMDAFERSTFSLCPGAWEEQAGRAVEARDDLVGFVDKLVEKATNAFDIEAYNQMQQIAGALQDQVFKLEKQLDAQKAANKNLWKIIFANGRKRHEQTGRTNQAKRANGRDDITTN